MLRCEWGLHRAKRKSIAQGSAGGRGGMERTKKEGWVYPLLKRVVRQALLEFLSRLNGATEGNIESITLVLLTYSPPLSLSSFLLTLLISPRVVFSLCLSAPHCPYSVLTPLCFVSIASHERWSLASQPIKLTAIIVAVADQKLWPLVGNVIYNGCNVLLLTAQWKHSHGHTFRQGLAMHIHAWTWPHFRHLAFYDSYSRLYLNWRFPAQFLFNLIPLNFYNHIFTSRVQGLPLAVKTCTLRNRLCI